MLLRVIWFQSTKMYKWASSEELVNPSSQHFKNCCRNFTLLSPLLVLRVRGAEAAHNHSAKNKLPKTVCKELPSAAYNSLYNQHHQKPKQLHPDTGASAAHPMLPAWGCLTAALMGTGTFEATLAQTMPHLSLVSTKRKSICLPWISPAVQARTRSPARPELMLNKHPKAMQHRHRVLSPSWFAQPLLHQF